MFSKTRKIDSYIENLQDCFDKIRLSDNGSQYTNFLIEYYFLIQECISGIVDFKNQVEQKKLSYERYKKAIKVKEDDLYKSILDEVMNVMGNIKTLCISKCSGVDRKKLKTFIDFRVRKIKKSNYNQLYSHKNFLGDLFNYLIDKDCVNRGEVMGEISKLTKKIDEDYNKIIQHASVLYMENWYPTFVFLEGLMDESLKFRLKTINSTKHTDFTNPNEDLVSNAFYHSYFDTDKIANIYNKKNTFNEINIFHISTIQMLKHNPLSDFMNKSQVEKKEEIESILFISKGNSFHETEDCSEFMINNDLSSLRKMTRSRPINKLIQVSLGDSQVKFDSEDYRQLNRDKSSLYLSGKYKKTKIILNERSRYLVNPKVKISFLKRDSFRNKFSKKVK